MTGYIWRDMSRMCGGEKKMIKRLTFRKVWSLTGGKEIWMAWSLERLRTVCLDFIPSDTEIWFGSRLQFEVLQRKKTRKPLRSETIHTLAYSQSLPVCIIQIRRSMDFCESNTTTYSSCLSANLCSGFSQESIIKIRLEITGFVNMHRFILLFLCLSKKGRLSTCRSF